MSSRTSPAQRAPGASSSVRRPPGSPRSPPWGREAPRAPPRWRPPCNGRRRDPRTQTRHPPGSSSPESVRSPRGPGARSRRRQQRLRRRLDPRPTARFRGGEITTSTAGAVTVGLERRKAGRLDQQPMDARRQPGEDEAAVGIGAGLPRPQRDHAGVRDRVDQLVERPSAQGGRGGDRGRVWSSWRRWVPDAPTTAYACRYGRARRQQTQERADARAGRAACEFHLAVLNVRAFRRELKWQRIVKFAPSSAGSRTTSVTRTSRRRASSARTCAACTPSCRAAPTGTSASRPLPPLGSRREGLSVPSPGGAMPLPEAA